MRPLQPTSRTQLLALSELARRSEQGLPGVSAEVGLGPFELKVFSQNGEDGVIAEILRRGGISSPGYFVEFGAEDGVELNSAVLADAFGWSGTLLEADPYKHHDLHRKYASNQRITLGHALVEPDSVEELFTMLDVRREIDLLSIDIDGGDYWVWAALRNYSAKVVVIEFNANLDPRVPLVQDPSTGPWDGTDFYGCSLEALRLLGESKGYRLVHVEMTGNNAFFVRNDVPGDYPELIETLGPNHYLLGGAHPPDEAGRQYITPPVPEPLPLPVVPLVEHAQAEEAEPEPEPASEASAPSPRRRIRPW